MHSERIRFYRSRIPTFACQPGCHDCCGPVLASTTEVARLPEVSAMRRARAERSWSCPYLGKDGCTVYPDRPLICRLFGTTPRLRCPNGCAPEAPVASALEADIEAFMRRVRHVLI